MSEHELRIQRSLQKINVPEWYKNNARSGYNSATSTGLLRRREYQPGGTGTGSSLRNGSLSGGWAGLSQRDGTTSSMTSLGSGLSRSGTPTRVVIPTRVRPDWRNVKSSRESLISPDGTGAASLSLAATQQPIFSWSGPPSLNSTTGGGQQQQQLQSPFPRWGSGRSSYSTCPSPSPSASSTLTTYRSSLLNQHGRQPYLGWRSQEKLNSGPPPLSIYRTPAERLASSLKKSEADQQQSPMSSPIAATPVSCTATATITGPEADEIRSSIRQVTSAIVHYVSGDSDDCVDGRNRDRRNGTRSPERHPLEALSRSPSPRRQRVWLESSFIGLNPPDVTTTTETTTTTSISPTSSRNIRKTTVTRPESPPSASPPPQLPPSSNHRVNNQRPGELMA